MPLVQLFDYQFENFDPAPDEELICSICRCVFFDPVECPCRHVFCRKCITQWLTHHKNCPACRKRISKSTLQGVVPLVKNMIMKLTVRCRNSEKGCKAKCTVELYESHLKTCGYEMIECGNGICGAIILRMNKEEHENNECPFRTITCDRCMLNVQFSVWQNHDCVRELLNIIQEREAKIAELQQATDVLKQDIEKLKTEREISKTSNRMSSDSSDFGSMSSISMSATSSNYEESDLEDYSVRIFSVVHPTESYSVSADIVNESQNGDFSVQAINRTEDSLPMDSTNNYLDDSPKSSSPDLLDSNQYSHVSSPDLSEAAGQASNSYHIPNPERFSQSYKRSLKRRMYDSAENAVLLNQSTRSSPPRSPIYDNFWAFRRSRMSYSDTEVPKTYSASKTSSYRTFPVYQDLGEQVAEAENETIEIFDSSAEDVNSSNAYPNLPSSSYALSENSWNSNPHSNMYVCGSNMSSSQERCHSRTLRQREIKGLNGKACHMDDKNSESNAPCSRVPLPIANPGSSSTPMLSNQKVSYRPVRNHRSSEGSDARSSNHAAFNPGLKKTLSLLTKYAGTETDPDWVPSGDCHEESDTSSTTTTSSSTEKSLRLGEDLSNFSPIQEQQGRESDDSDYYCGNSESWTTDISETDSSYEVEIPPTAWDLIQRYCDDDDSEDDSEWIPASASSVH